MKKYKGYQVTKNTKRMEEIVTKVIDDMGSPKDTIYYKMFNKNK